MRESAFSILHAAFFHSFLTATPAAIGKSMSSRFCPMRLPTGRCIGVPVLPSHAAVACMMRGMVNNVMTLLKAVSDTDRATSPFASIENTFDELPPGEQAISITPTKNRASSLKTQAHAKAIRGRSTICPMSPATTGRGR